MLHRFHVALASLCLVVLGPTSAALASAIGIAEEVVTQSYRTPVGGVEDGLAKEDPVFADDLIATDRSGAARLAMADQTVITVGPGSRVSLDRFLYDPATNTGEVATRVAVGGLRFVSGHLPHGSYSVLTPTAVIGLRGTDITVQINAVTGVTRVIVLVGEVGIRPTGCLSDIVVPAGRMVDIPPFNGCGAEPEIAAPLPQWARGRLFQDTRLQVGFDIRGNDPGEGTGGDGSGGGSAPAGGSSPGGSRGGNSTGGPAGAVD